VPVDADGGRHEVIFVDERTSQSLGIKGGGESASSRRPAIANAVYHATGKRVRRPADHAGQVGSGDDSSSAVERSSRCSTLVTVMHGDHSHRRRVPVDCAEGTHQATKRRTQ